MKKLLILIVLFTALCYLGKAHAQQPSKKWQECAKAVIHEEVLRAKYKPQEVEKDLCAFYKKPLPECLEILANVDDQQAVQLFQGYLLHGLIIPACGTPDEAK
jgi:hypothetical protein